MKKMMDIRKPAFAVGATVAAWLFVSPAAWAAGSDAAWRSTYDIIMMWVNFVILVALLVKLLKKPLRDFLSGQRDTIAGEIDKLKKQKEESEAKISDIRQEMRDRKDRFAEVYRNILEAGEKERQEIIEAAHRQADIMIGSARQRIDNRLRKAGDILRDELIDAAMEIAVSELPKHVSPENSRQWANRFISDIDKTLH